MFLTPLQMLQAGAVVVNHNRQMNEQNNQLAEIARLNKEILELKKKELALMQNRIPSDFPNGVRPGKFILK